MATVDDVEEIELFGVGPAGVGITAAEKTTLDNRLTALEADVLTGSGDPERVVIAPVGAFYVRTTGGAATTLYYKAAGAASGGWRRIGTGEARAGWTGGVTAKPNTATLIESGMGAWTLDGTASNNDLSSSPYVKFATGAVSGNKAGPNGPAEFRRDWNPDVEFKVRTPATLTNINLWVALADTDPAGGVSPVFNIAGFRFDTSVDTKWTCRCGDGTAGGASDSGITVAASTVYRMRIVLTSGIVRFYIDDAYVDERTTNLPTGAAYLRPYVRVTTQTAAARDFSFSYFNFYRE